MKKFTLLLVFAAMGLVTLSSCSKEHTCECTTSNFGGGQTTTKTVITDSKKKAQEECDKMDSQSTGTTTECEIK